MQPGNEKALDCIRDSQRIERLMKYKPINLRYDTLTDMWRLDYHIQDIFTTWTMRQIVNHSLRAVLDLFMQETDK